MSIRSLSYLLLGALLLTPAWADDDKEKDKDEKPDGRKNYPLYHPGLIGFAGQAGTTATIRYHGGPVMLNTVNVYYIWYGNWAGNSATTILTDLANNIGSSPYFNINTTYYDSASRHVSNSVAYKGAINNNYSLGTSLSDANIKSVVSSAITSGQLPADPNGVYFVLTSQDVTASSGFCTQYCGWHTHGSINGIDIKYSFVGNAARCPNACSAVTSGATANMKLGARDWLIQQNWVNSGNGFCAVKFP